MEFQASVNKAFEWLETLQGSSDQREPGEKEAIETLAKLVNDARTRQRNVAVDKLLKPLDSYIITSGSLRF